MITENELRNQLAICKTLHEQGKWDKDLPEGGPDRQNKLYLILEEKWEVAGYVSALRYVLGEMKPKFDKGDI